MDPIDTVSLREYNDVAGAFHPAQSAGAWESSRTGPLFTITALTRLSRKTVPMPPLSACVNRGPDMDDRDTRHQESYRTAGDFTGSTARRAHGRARCSPRASRRARGSACRSPRAADGTHSPADRPPPPLEGREAYPAGKLPVGTTPQPPEALSPGGTAPTSTSASRPERLFPDKNVLGAAAAGQQEGLFPRKKSQDKPSHSLRIVTNALHSTFASAATPPRHCATYHRPGPRSSRHRNLRPQASPASPLVVVVWRPRELPLA